MDELPITTRAKIGECIEIAPGIELAVVGIEDGQVRLQINAPDDVLFRPAEPSSERQATPIAVADTIGMNEDPSPRASNTL